MHVWGILALSLQNELPEAVEGARILNEVLLLPSGKYRLEYWADGKYASKKPMDVNRDAVIWTAGKPLTIKWQQVVDMWAFLFRLINSFIFIENLS